MEKGLAALGQSHAEPGNTIEMAAQKTGLDAGALGSILEQFGGESALGDLMGKVQGAGALAGLGALLDADKDGNPLNDIVGMAKGLFGKS
ncbi:MAG: hypothetical protein ACKO1N_11745 [Erythrobacter sp.]